jgi:putative ABC transport system substrate-binding protein
LQTPTAFFAARLPTMFGFRGYVLISYGLNTPQLFRRGADYVNNIFRGAKPAEMPVEQPNKFDLITNLKTAKALRIDIPATLLSRAGEVIE